MDLQHFNEYMKPSVGRAENTQVARRIRTAWPVLLMAVGVLAAGATPAAAAPGGLDLGGSDAYVDFGNPAELRLSQFTIELWLRRDGPGVGANTGGGGIPDAIPLVAKGRSEDERPEVDINYLFGIRASDGVLVADFEEDTSGATPSLNHPVVGATPIATGTWHHAAATYDGTTWQLYLDGFLEAELLVGAPPAIACSSAVALGSALRSTGIASGFFDGAVDEVRIWNYARTQAEIVTNANQQITKAKPGLVARWALDEGTGTVVHGTAGTSVTGTIVGTAWSWGQGAPFDLGPVPAPGALDLAGTDAYVDFGAPAALGLSTFTIELWLRRDGPGLSTDTGADGLADAIPLVAKGRGEAELEAIDVNYLLGIRAADGVLVADFEEGALGDALGNGPSQNHPIAGLTPITTGVWHHAAATYDGVTWRLYLDGGLEAELVVGRPPAAGSAVAASLGSALNSSGVPAGFFAGAIDEARIWDHARTQAEIVAAINAQITNPTPGLVARWGLEEGAGVLVHGSAGTTHDGAIEGTAWRWMPGAPFNLGPPTPPAAPTALTAAALDATQILVQWTDSSSNELHFDVERSTGGSGGPFEALITLPAGTVSYEDTDLSPSSEYCYRVRARNGAGGSAWSNVSCATTTASAGTALDLGGSDAYVHFGNPPELGLAEFTIELWLRRDGAGIGTNTGGGGISDAIPLVAKGRSENENPDVDVNYLFGIRASDGVLVADFEEGALGSVPSQNHPVAGVTPIATGAWHHAAATYDGTTWRLYLDGALEADLDVGEPPAASCTTAVALGSALRSTGVAAGFFDGVVDEVRIWDHARMQAEIVAAANTQITSPTPGLVARWGLDEGSGTQVHATAGTSADGAIVGTAWSRAAGAPFDLEFGGPPGAPVLVAPADGAPGAPLSPVLTVNVSDPEADDLTVTFHGRKVPPSAAEDFTLIGLPDTQYYVGTVNGGAPEIFDAQVEWIVDERAARNIAYVVQLGDCVENGDNGGNPIEWQRAEASLSLLENPVTTGLAEGIPFGVCVGNHDQSPLGDADGTTIFYNQFFGTARFAGRTYYGGHHGSNNDNWYELFSAGGMDFIVIAFEFDLSPDPAVLAWADQLLTTHANRRAIVTSHWIVGKEDPADFGTQGQAIYDALKSHANLFLMLGGHVPGEGRRQDTYAGHTVHSLLADYQGRENGGDGWLRVMEFSPAHNVIRVRTYSPWLDEWEADADSSSQFTIPYVMSGGEPFEAIAVDAGVPSGSQASAVWPGLVPGAGYEWYVTVSDGITTVTGPTWRFTTEGEDTTGPAVRVVAPNGGEALQLGENATLEWEATDAVGVTSVDLLLSRVGPAGPFETLAEGLANTGSYVWNATGPGTSDGRLKVLARDAALNAGEDVSDASFTIDNLLDVPGAPGVAWTLALGPVRPNPARGTAQFAFELPRADRVRVEVVDVQGRVVATVVDGDYEPGRHAARWDGAGAGGRSSAGIYFLRLRTSGRDLWRRFAYLR